MELVEENLEVVTEESDISDGYSKPFSSTLINAL